MSGIKDIALSFSGLRIGYENLELIGEGNGSVKEGELVALIGRNGCGKSTLLRVLAGLNLAGSGELFLRGRAMTAYSSHERAKAISFVSTGLSVHEDLSVYEVVALGRYPHTGWWGRLDAADEERISSALGAVNMTGFEKRRISRLSDGERQRVMMARALAQDGELIIMDEPTAFLDLPNKFEMIDLLHKLSRQGKSIVYSTHDIEAAWTYADKLWIIHGKDMHEGSPEDLGLSGLYDELFRNSPVRLDSANMRFRSDRSITAEVVLHGNNEEMLQWTEMALNRAGYIIVAENREIPVIDCIKNEGRLKWDIEANGKKETCYSLYDLIALLTRNK